MTITELIKELEKIKAEHGDLEVGMVSTYTCQINFEVTVRKSVCCRPKKFKPNTGVEKIPYCEIYIGYTGKDY